MDLPQETLDKLRATHGDDLHQLEAADVAVVVRPPLKAEYRRFRAKSAEDRTRPDALEELARACVVFPDRAAFDQILERKPGLADVFGAKLLELAGVSGEADARKL